ncbi:glycosyltransferase [Litorihabitans aurantiacus]|uniref:glycosyltransferase n=1 Tax=Litorihabitans aurantiacus TaxID=1930061 RepID=UPI0024E14EE1|nr:glycosyltransferase [Litorihabitans aurantiacus]
MSDRTDPGAQVCAVVVAWNRRDLLVEVLDALRGQTLRPTRVVVVDNASDDDSAQVAASYPEVDLVRLTRNTGGAGGFAAGLAHALAGASGESDWVWLMDDDTVPTATALAELVRVAQAAGADVAGSRVIWTDGREHPMNTPRENPFATAERRRAARAAGGLDVRSTSFVSMLARTAVVRRHGLPVADYFIWNDDFEYSTRLIRGGTGVHVPSSVVVHKTKALGATDVDPGARFFHEVRNKVWLFTRSRSLAPREKLVYGASTLRRWVRTVARSGSRGLLVRCLLRGLRDGVLTRPRRTAVVLEDLGETTALVARAEAARG